MTDVVVFPQSGYINRLQCMASAAILAGALGAEWYVCWENQPVAPAAPDDLFAESVLRDHFVTSEETRRRWGLVKAALPLYLTSDERTGRVVVAGHERGEQSLMPGLRRILENGLPPVIAVVGGGKFFLSGDEALSTAQAAEFRELRRAQYASLEFAPSVEDSARQASDARGPFLGLHLRYSDRSLEAPWRRDIWPALERLRSQTGLADVFVASDSTREGARWTRLLGQRGMLPWSVPAATLDRSDPVSALAALIDWRILTRSAAMVYFSASSFAEEAAVASGAFDLGIGLPPSRTRAAWVTAQQYGRSAVTYPTRHGWLRRPSAE